MLAQIQVVCLKNTAKIYDFDGTFNVIVSGELHDQKSGRTYKRFDVVSDFPFMTNMIDYSKPLTILTTQQKQDTECALQSKGIETKNALRFICATPQTYIIQVNFKINTMVGKLPLNDIFRAVKNLHTSLQSQYNKILAQRVLDQTPYTDRICFISEHLLKKQEQMDLESNCVYFVFVGNLALGKRII